MSIQIKSLTMTVPTKELSLAAPLDTFNTVPTANEVYDLYTAPNSGGFARSAIAKTIRLVNTHATNAVKVSLYYNKPMPTARTAAACWPRPIYCSPPAPPTSTTAN